MALLNTFIYPVHLESAGEHFEAYINEEVILMIVLGNDPLAQKAVAEANLQANDSYHGVPRRVLWLPDHQTERAKCLDMLRALEDFNPVDYDQLLAFSVKPLMNQAAYAIFPTDVPSDITLTMRIKIAFFKAGEDIADPNPV